ncbi:MAG: helix-turn-helix domain-containing protein [Myxococcales bacterium]|nr:helix-turn-helix domain-containing protein [Myxococcales bacterium]
MHFGATLRLMRLESGLGLRELAGRLGVSSAYLSRVENGLDAAPTPTRLEAMARELRVPSTLLMDLAQRVSPLVMDYVESVPEAGSLFLQLAHRELDAEQLAEVQAFVESRFPVRRRAASAFEGLADLLTPERVVVGLACSSLDDALDVAAGRLGREVPGGASKVAAALRGREGEVSSAIGSGVAIPCAYVPGVKLSAALVVLSPGLRAPTPDGAPLEVVVAFVGPRDSAERRIALAHVARLASRGLALDLRRSRSPAQVLTRLAQLETLR